jgi:chloramphenicol O-acetyltransferase type A
MLQYLDLDTWSRRETFEYFRDFDKPYFNVCVHLDVTKLVDLGRRANISPFLAYHYLSLRMANDTEPFRYRLHDGKVVIYDLIHGGSTLLLPNDSFAFVYFDYQEDFQRFAEDATEAIETIRRGDGAFEPRDDHDDLIHFTTLPWISFTSFSHARNWHRDDSVPKIAFGRFNNLNGTVLLPMSVEVHHALMDGLHVGRFVNKIEAALLEPENYLNVN